MNWTKGQDPAYPTFVGIPSAYKAQDGSRVVSGQVVEVSGRMTEKKAGVVRFDPNFGFMVITLGARGVSFNLAEATVHSVTQKPYLSERAYGLFRFFLFCLRGLL